MSKRDEFIKAFKVPPVFLSYLDHIAGDREMDLVLTLQNKKKTRQEIAASMGWSRKEAEKNLANAVFRGIVSKETDKDADMYTSADFHKRLIPIAINENWVDFPLETREAVEELHLKDYIEQCRPVLEEIKINPVAYHDIPNRDILLLEEALEMVDGAAELLVLPCDCRSVSLTCNFPKETCIRMDRGVSYTLELGLGRRISKDECKTIILDADRAGLMHSGLKAWKENPDKLFGLCGCCTCCCFPIRSGIRFDMEKQYPRSHYVAHYNSELCEICGKCAERCHFQAFTFENKRVNFEPRKCWGCGLCATTCPANAIKMAPLS